MQVITRETPDIQLSKDNGGQCVMAAKTSNSVYEMNITLHGRQVVGHLDAGARIWYSLRNLTQNFSCCLPRGRTYDFVERKDHSTLVRSHHSTIGKRWISDYHIFPLTACLSQGISYRAILTFLKALYPLCLHFRLSIVKLLWGGVHQPTHRCLACCSACTTHMPYPTTKAIHLKASTMVNISLGLENTEYWLI